MGNFISNLKSWFLGLDIKIKVSIIVGVVILIGGLVSIPIFIMTSSNNVEIAKENDDTEDNTESANEKKSEKSDKEEQKDDEGEQDDDGNASDSNNAGQYGQSVNRSGTGSSKSNSSSSSTAQKPQSSSSQSNNNSQQSTPANTETSLRNERDQKRREDMAKLRTSVYQYQTNNNGKLPQAGSPALQPSKTYFTIEQYADNQSCLNDSAKCFVTRYMNSQNVTNNAFIDPSGWAYGLTIIHYDNYLNSSNKNQQYMIYLVHQSRCGTATSVLRTDGARDFSVLYKLENGSTYCIDNQ